MCKDKLSPLPIKGDLCTSLSPYSKCLSARRAAHLEMCIMTGCEISCYRGEQWTRNWRCSPRMACQRLILYYKPLLKYESVEVGRSTIVPSMRKKAREHWQVQSHLLTRVWTMNFLTMVDEKGPSLRLESKLTRYAWVLQDGIVTAEPVHSHSLPQDNWHPVCQTPQNKILRTKHFYRQVRWRFRNIKLSEGKLLNRIEDT